MLGRKPKSLKEHTTVSLENLVPQNNFYRKLEATLDLSFVRELVQGQYSPMGRPSIDPVVFFKLQLIMFFEGIRSERQLMESVNLHLAHRWYIGYDLHERVPDHSSLTKIRQRYGLEVFQRFFEHIVELCIQAGLVWGKELYFDGTKIKANADLDKMVPRFYWEAKQHLNALFPEVDKTETLSVPETPRGLVEKYSGQRLLGDYNNSYARLADYRVCPTDPDATPFFSKQASSGLGYHLHYVVDGGKARIILAALVTPASIMDNTPMLDLARWVRFRWQLHPDIAVGDAKYSTRPNIVGLEQDGIRAYLAKTDHSLRTKVYSIEKFQYDSQLNLYICPQNQQLPLSGIDTHLQSFTYRAPAKVCKHCPVKPECTTGKYGRVIQRSVDQDYLDRVTSYQSTPAYKKAMRKRGVWIEPMFGEAKQWHQSVKFRLRRIDKVNIQSLLTAAGQNIKRLLQPRHLPHLLPPAVAIALDVSTQPLSFNNFAYSFYVSSAVF